MRLFCAMLSLLVASSVVNAQETIIKRSDVHIMYDVAYRDFLISSEQFMLESKDPYKRRRRVLGKAMMGLLVGGVTAAATGLIGAKLEDCGRYKEFCGWEGAIIGGMIGFPFGVAMGVTLLDSTDRFIPVVLASLAGFGGGVAMTVANEGLVPFVIVLPIVTATIASEKSRRDVAEGRLSIHVASGSEGGLSALATLQF